MTEGICIPLEVKPDLIRNVVMVGLHDYVSIILYLTIHYYWALYTRNYTVPLKIYFSYFPCGKKVDVLML